MTASDPARAADRRGELMKPWKIYDVTVVGYGTGTLTAPSRGKALARTWRCGAFDAFSFGDFIRIASARVRAEPPIPDGYNYVRRTYGVDVRIGQEVALRNEGERRNGRRGIVLYPGQSTAHVHVQFEDMDRPLVVHPDNVVVTPPPQTGPATADDGGER